MKAGPIIEGIVPRDAMINDLENKIKTLARSIGYADCGITHTEIFEEDRQAIHKRMADFPEASGLYRDMEGRWDPRSKFPWARSIIVCIRRYGKYDIPKGLVGYIGRNYLCDRRHEACPDHVFPQRMKQGLQELGLKIAKASLPERWAAARAGMAYFGRNNFSYTRYGSWINIETWVTDAPLKPDTPDYAIRCPEKCRACIKACPTGALSAPFNMRMDRCIAHLTFGDTWPVAPELWQKMGKWIYGCDVCQDVCPMNKGKWEELERADWMYEKEKYLNPEFLCRMTREEYEKIIHPLFWYISLEDTQRWHRNACRSVNRECHSGR